MNSLPFVIGHRGAAGLSPENTLDSIRRAREEGATWVEFDVKLCKDDVAVLFHDDTLQRTTSGVGMVADTVLRDLQSLDAGGWFADAFRDLQVPTLLQTFDVLAELGMGANIEIKPSPGAWRETAVEACNLIRAHWPARLPPPVISSFDLLALQIARDELPETERAVLFYALPRDWRQTISDIDGKAVHLMDSSTTPEIVDSINLAGFPVRIFTVNDPARAETLRRWGVQSIFTDRPDLIKDGPSS